MTEEKKNPPIQTFKAGPVRAAIWSRTAKNRDGTEFDTYSVQIDKTYKKGEDFLRTNNFNPQDLPRLSLVANRAFEWIVTRNGQDKEKQEKN